MSKSSKTNHSQQPEKNNSLAFSRSDFPPGFRFGVATSAYQIEGSQFGGCGESHWDYFARKPGNVVNNENGLIACDHYHRYPEDVRLMAELGVDAYRFSTSWARVQPYGKGAANTEGLDFYSRLVDECLANDLEPHLTLYHWELPQKLSEKGGWTNRDTALRFADYTELVIARIGDRVKSVATLNELWCVAWLSHYLGHHAPGLTSLDAAAKAMHYVLLAHGVSLQAMRAMGQDNLGIALNFEHAVPADDRESSILAAERYDGIYNRWFIEAITTGKYPEDIVEPLADYMPEDFSDDMSLISQPIDWMGINYYTRQNIKASTAKEFPATETAPGLLPKTDMGWEIDPKSLTNFLQRISQQLGPDMPIFITENGCASPEPLIDGEVNDVSRIDYLNQHFDAALQAIDSGVNLQGYFVWSFMDNYEWAFGYGKRFGLVHVAFDDELQRIPKASYYALQSALSK